MSTVTDKLKTIQADALAMYVKVHNYHWNIKGVQFYPVHNMTEGIYDGMSDLYDDCAERVLQLGQKPYVRLSEVSAATRIQEETKTEFDAKYVLENILADYETMLKAFRELSDVADEAGDKATVAFADDKVASFEKDIWMLKASLA